MRLQLTDVILNSVNVEKLPLRCRPITYGSLRGEITGIRLHAGRDSSANECVLKYVDDSQHYFLRTLIWNIDEIVVRLGKFDSELGERANGALAYVRG